MKNMFKLLVATLVVASLAACSSPKKEEAKVEATPTPSASAEATATPEASASAEAKEEAKAMSYKAGVYTESVDGRNGPIEVTVKFSDTMIEEVSIKNHTETAGIADPAIEKIPAMIVEKQSADVDAVSGATITSEAIKTAVKAAIEEATQK